MVSGLAVSVEVVSGCGDSFLVSWSAGEVP